MKYSTVGRKKKALAVASLIMLILTAAAILVYEARNVKPAWDESYPIVNAHISWEQTFYGGSQK